MDTLAKVTLSCIQFPAGRRDLPATFVPDEHDVICGKGKVSFNHNKNFRKVVGLYLESYSNAISKAQKSAIVSTIIQNIRQSSDQEGGFVKKDTTTGVWYEVGDHLAREKVGQAFRDALHTQYRSSTKAKKSKRQLEQAKACSTLAEISNTNMEISSTMDELMDRVLLASCSPTTNDRQLSDLFTQANLDILNELNRLNEIRQQSNGEHFPKQ